MKPIRRLAAFLLLVAVASAPAAVRPAHAELRLDINRGNLQPMPIAVTTFLGDNEASGKTGSDIANVISADLERSGLFKPIDRAAFIQTPESIGLQPRFSDWRLINAQALVQGNVSAQRDGRLRVEFRLWDVFGEQQMTGLAYFTQPANWRRVAHIVADAIYQRITGEQGYFDTRIVYVAESGSATQRVKRLAIMDQDGANHSYLTDGRFLVLTPRFSPNRQEITYLSYDGNMPRVNLLNVDTNRTEVLGRFRGMTFAPRFSPDGDRVIMTMTEDGNAEIYVMDLRTRNVQRLTSNPAIDTAPSFAPDGRQVTFESDRSGTQQIYVMNSDGSGAKRISFGDGRYATPVWSPRGDLIAFTRMQGGTFYIGVMRPDGSGERSLTEGFLAEGPTWAPNGRVIAFFRSEPSDSRGRGGRTRLYSIDITGYNLRELPTPGDASDPAWSPLSP